MPVFNMIVSNPPYSAPWEGDLSDPRFAPAGVLAPKSKADMAFVMGILSSSERAAIVVFPGVLYRNGAEKKIRMYLADNGFVDSIIQLPAGLFTETSIATCVMTLRRNRGDNAILFVDASKGLPDEPIEREDVEHLSRVASLDEVRACDYNLSVSSYVEPEDTREPVDIDALNAEIDAIVAREQTLRDEIEKIIAEIGG